MKVVPRFKCYVVSKLKVEVLAVAAAVAVVVVQIIVPTAKIEEERKMWVFTIMN